MALSRRATSGHLCPPVVREVRCHGHSACLQETFIGLPVLQALQWGRPVQLAVRAWGAWVVGVWQLGLVLTPPPQTPRLGSRSLFWVQHLQILLPVRRGSCQGVFRSEVRSPAVTLCVRRVRPDCRHPLPVSPRPLTSETALRLGCAAVTWRASKAHVPRSLPQGPRCARSASGWSTGLLTGSGPCRRCRLCRGPGPFSSLSSQGKD